MVLPLIMKTENDFKLKKMQQFLKTAAQVFEAGNFLNILLRF